MKRFLSLLATGFGAGYFPVAPGTAGSAWAIILLLAVRWALLKAGIGVPLVLLCIMLAVVLYNGALASTAAEKELGKDSGHIVIDEMVGMWMALFMVPIRWDTVLIAFLLFRLLDIVKIYPINKAEKIPEGWGVMMDDALAGIFTNLLADMFDRLLDDRSGFPAGFCPADFYDERMQDIPANRCVFDLRMKLKAEPFCLGIPYCRDG